MTNGSRVMVALRVDSTPEVAFEAFTTQIGTWWRPNGLFQFSEGRTGTLAFEPGPTGRRSPSVRSAAGIHRNYW